MSFSNHIKFQGLCYFQGGQHSQLAFQDPTLMLNHTGIKTAGRDGLMNIACRCGPFCCEDYVMKKMNQITLLGQWLNFFWITCLVGKIKFKYLFQGPPCLSE